MHAVVKSIVAAAAICTSSAHAGVILPDQMSANVPIERTERNEPIGPSFLAQDGDTLANLVFAIPAGLNGFYDVDFSAVSLTAGNMFTAALSVPGSSPYWDASRSTSDNPYRNGRAYLSSGRTAPDYGKPLRVTTLAKEAPQRVPEPGTVAIVSIGLAGLVVSSQKKA